MATSLKAGTGVLFGAATEVAAKFRHRRNCIGPEAASTATPSAGTDWTHKVHYLKTKNGLKSFGSIPTGHHSGAVLRQPGAFQVAHTPHSQHTFPFCIFYSKALTWSHTRAGTPEAMVQL